MMLASESLSRVQSRADSICNDDTQYFSPAASPGDWVRQGDIKITLLEGPPVGASKIKPVAQLAPGTTKGSRHILDSLEGVTCYKYQEDDVLQGPVIQLATERTITHPQHGNWVLPPGTYSITYQRAYAEERRRRED